MPTYTMSMRNVFNDGHSDVHFTTEAPNAEIAEYLIKKQISRLMRSFPTGSLGLMLQQSSQHNPFMSQGAFEAQGDAVIDRTAAASLLPLDQTWQNQYNGQWDPVLELAPGDKFTINGSSLFPNGEYTVLEPHVEVASTE